MKKYIIIAIAAIAALTTGTAYADNDRPITVNQLPQASQEFIKKYFPNEKVAFAKEDSDLFGTTYDVVFTSGSKVEFLKDGSWKEIDCRYAAVPAEVVPAQIAAYINGTYPETKVVSIDRDRRDIEVKISNGLELTFDLKYNIIDIDD